MTNTKTYMFVAEEDNCVDKCAVRVKCMGNNETSITNSYEPGISADNAIRLKYFNKMVSD